MSMNLRQFELGTTGVAILSALGTKVSKTIVQKMKYYIQDFFSKYQKICGKFCNHITDTP